MTECFNGTIPYIIKQNDTIYSLAEKYNTTVAEIMELNPDIVADNLRIGEIILLPCFEGYSGDLLDNLLANNEVLALNNIMRKLWEQHIAWTHLAIIDIIFDIPDLHYVIPRLLRNPIDFANAFRFFYQDEIAEELDKLLTDHLVIASGLIKAEKNKDKLQIDNLNNQLYANADDIARFLSDINPYWKYEDWQEMFYDHLGLVKENVNMFLTNQHEAKANIYDTMEQQALEMADMMTVGIVNQFSSEFYDEK